MKNRVPSRYGLWLLARLGPRYHRESLEGDLIEQCARGRSRWWAWREILVAIVSAQALASRLPSWVRVARALWWCLTEVAIVLSVILIADRSREAHSVRDLIAPTFIGTLLVLISIASLGLRSLIHLSRRQHSRAGVRHLVAIFVVMTLGVGTLTWAATVHRAERASAPREHHDRMTHDLRPSYR